MSPATAFPVGRPPSTSTSVQTTSFPLRLETHRVRLDDQPGRHPVSVSATSCTWPPRAFIHWTTGPRPPFVTKANLSPSGETANSKTECRQSSDNLPRRSAEFFRRLALQRRTRRSRQTNRPAPIRVRLTTRNNADPVAVAPFDDDPTIRKTTIDDELAHHTDSACITPFRHALVDGAIAQSEDAPRSLRSGTRILTKAIPAPEKHGVANVLTANSPMRVPLEVPGGWRLHEVSTTISIRHRAVVGAPTLETRHRRTGSAYRNLTRAPSSEGSATPSDLRLTGLKNARDRE